MPGISLTGRRSASRNFYAEPRSFPASAGLRLLCTLGAADALKDPGSALRFILCPGKTRRSSVALPPRCFCRSVRTTSCPWVSAALSLPLVRGLRYFAREVSWFRPVMWLSRCRASVYQGRDLLLVIFTDQQKSEIDVRNSFSDEASLCRLPSGGFFFFSRPLFPQNGRQMAKKPENARTQGLLPLLPGGLLHRSVSFSRLEWPC